MRGPIDFLIVGFEGNNFNGGVLTSLADAVKNGVIDVLDLVVISKDNEGTVTVLDLSKLGDGYTLEIFSGVSGEFVKQEDIDETGELLENNTSAGLLIIEQLWAKPLKKALIDAGGVLVSEGRIHPEAAEELNQGSEV